MIKAGNVKLGAKLTVCSNNPSISLHIYSTSQAHLKNYFEAGMITKYFKTVALKVPPVGHATKVGRVFMANLPPRSRADVKVDFKLLDNNNQTPELKVTYKDGTTISADIMNIASNEMVETFDRHSRKLQIQDTINE